MLSRLVAVALLAITPAAQTQQAGDPIAAKLGVSAYSIQSLHPAAGTLALELRGQRYIADLSLDPVETPECTMLLDDGGPAMVEVPAPPPCTYRGEVRGVEGSLVSGGIVNGQFTGIVVLPGEAWNILPLSELDPAAPRGLHIVSRFDDSLPGDWRCGVDDSAAPAFNARPATHGSDAVLYCDLAIEADYPYYQQVGGVSASAVAQDISTVIANVTSYSILSGTNVRFRIVRYIIRTSPGANPPQYNTTNPNTLLQGFRTVWLNLASGISRDLSHMFTGKDLDGQTVGIAYLGVVCNIGSDFGLSQSRFSLQPGRRAALTAHEIGHNFTARHCDQSPNTCTPCWIMKAVQGNTTNELTRYGCSTSVISNYALTRGCMGPTDSGAWCPADFDGDGRAGPGDFAAYHHAFTFRDPSADLDASGEFNIRDLSAFLNHYAAGCP